MHNYYYTLKTHFQGHAPWTPPWRLEFMTLAFKKFWLQPWSSEHCSGCNKSMYAFDSMLNESTLEWNTNRNIATSPALHVCEKTVAKQRAGWIPCIIVLLKTKKSRQLKRRHIFLKYIILYLRLLRNYQNTRGTESI